MPRRKLNIEKINEDILRVLRENNNTLLSTYRIAKMVGIHPSTIIFLLSDLQIKNLVEQARADYATYWKIRDEKHG